MEPIMRTPTLGGSGWEGAIASLEREGGQLWEGLPCCCPMREGRHERLIWRVCCPPLLITPNDRPLGRFITTRMEKRRGEGEDGACRGEIPGKCLWYACPMCITPPSAPSGQRVLDRPFSIENCGGQVEGGAAAVTFGRGRDMQEGWYSEIQRRAGEQLGV